MTKYCPEIVEEILGHARRGATQRDIAKLVGVHERTVWVWAATKPDFGDALAKAQAEGRQRSVEIIADSDDWRAHAWLLERKDPQHWAKSEMSAEAFQSAVTGYLQGILDARHAESGGSTGGAVSGRVIDVSPGSDPA